MVFGPLMLDLEGLSLTQEEAELLRHPCVGGVILFARNFVAIEQLTALVAEIRAVRADLLLAVDQEGGRVQRFREGFTRLPPMQRLGSPQGQLDLALLRDCGWLMAAEVMACGVDFSFAPVLDVDDCGCEVIADRSFNADPAVATTAARAFIEGMHEAGMAVTGKHFPGHGGVRADSHLETPFDYRTLAELEARDLIPFRNLVGQLDAVMPAHIVFPAVDTLPVGFSPRWLQQILRRDCGFTGVIFSDDLSMKGADIAGGYTDKARCALQAGCDMLLVCNNRAGALEVLDYLAGRSAAVNPRLGKMASKPHFSLPQLQASERWRNTRARLEKMS